jgi:hypothetical protein
MIELVEVALAAVGGTALVYSAAWRSRVREWREKYDRAVTALQEQQAENNALKRKVEDDASVSLRRHNACVDAESERDAALKELRALKRAAKAAGVKLTKPKRRVAAKVGR